MMVAMANPTTIMGCQYATPDAIDVKTPSTTPTDTEFGPSLQAETKADTPASDLSRLRPIIIDGSNVAMNHGNKRIYSCRGIKLCVDWFVARGHQDITVFVPQWRTEESKEDTPIQDRHILYDLESRDRLVFTPSRKVTVHVDPAPVGVCGDPKTQPKPGSGASVKEHRVICYDDRYIVKVACETGGIIVSNDNYRDLARESPAYARVIQDRLLMYTFVKDRFMPPDDPLGRNGPSLDEFLMLDPPTSPTPNKDLLIPICPYGPKCTYGNKCKFEHPERKTKMRKITKELVIQAQKEFEKYLNKDRSIPSNGGSKKALCRTYSLQNQPQATKTNPCASESVITNSRQTKGGPHHTRGGSLKNNETRRKPPPSYKLKHETSLPILDTLVSLSLLSAPKKALGKTISDPYGQMLSYPRTPHLYPFYPPPVGPLFNFTVPTMLTYPIGPAPSHCPTIPESWVYGGPPPHNNTNNNVFSNPEILLRPTVYNTFQPPHMSREFHQSNARDTFATTNPIATHKAASPQVVGIDVGKCALEKKLSAPPFLHSDRGDPGPANINQEGSSFSAWTQHPNSLTNLTNNEEQDQDNNAIVSLPPNILSFLSEYESKPSMASQNPWSSANTVVTTSASTSYGSDAHHFDVEHQNKRLTLYFHLASLFPQDHVKTVMNNYPDITDPRKLCSFLLKM